MKMYSLIFGAITIGLLIALIVTIIKYPLDIIRGFLSWIRPDPWRIQSWLLAPLWFLFYGLSKAFKWDIIENDGCSETDKSEEPYRSTRNLKFDFSAGHKYLSFSAADISSLFTSFIKFSEGNYRLEDFKIDPEEKLVKCPTDISFFDFSVLVQHVWNEQKERAYGLFFSPALSFYLYQDPETVHNLIGQTSDGRCFSVYTLHDLNKDTHLRLNDSLKVESFGVSPRSGK